MENVGWVQKPIYHQSCDLAHTYSHSDDTRTCLQEQVHFSTVDMQKENLSGSQRRGRDSQHLSHLQWCETPKLTKKDMSLRRRLLTSKSMTDLKTSVSRTPGCRDVYTQEAATESPDVLLRGPLSYSTLRSDAGTMVCMKRRLMFSQAVTSTLDDGKDEASPPLSESDLDESIISGLLPSETPEMQRGREGFCTPLTRLADDLSESLSVLSTPSHTPLSGLDMSVDSGFGSLRLDGLEDGDDGSFQEGASRVILCRDHRRSRLEHQRRLSTLREGSQSDDEVRGRRTNGQNLKLEEEVFAETPPLRVTQHDLSLTPALQAMEALSRSFTLSHDLERSISTCQYLSHDLEQPVTTHLPLSHLIGRKMGLGKVDILSELHMRNLHHILSIILQLLYAKDLQTCIQVCDSWSDIILQDRKANRRRRIYEREKKHVLEMGGATRVVDAETRLALACRSALGSVQAQAKTPSAQTHTPAAKNTLAHTPAANGAHSHTPPSTKRQQFLQVAKTLFGDECLRPCPRCERPARCHSVKAEGVCSWSECVFHFCTSCLRTYHGSADCTRLPNTHSRRKSRSQLLPGSAQSKRNVKRL